MTNNVRNPIELISGRVTKRAYFFCTVFSAVLTLIVEILGRRSVAEGFIFLAEYPVRFLYNTLIILLTLSISFLFEKRFFVFSLISAGWLGLGITNFVTQSYRTTPLSAIDFQNASIGIFAAYVGYGGIAVILLLAAFAVYLAVLCYRRTPRHKTVLFKSLLMMLVIAVSLVCLTEIGVATEYISDDYESMNQAYEDYGFAYCFTRSIVERGIEQPEDYEKNHSFLSSLASSDGDGPKIRPNIVMVQLESFFDVSHLKNITVSSDPTPVFSYLKSEADTVSGLFTVPYLGAGTVNTEFEVLTGMSIDFFGFGEYPYKTILADNTCESIPYILKKYGYTSTAIHDYEGTFYDRNIVYANLGFDRFVPMEFLTDTETNALGWVRDKAMLSQISDAMISTDSPDFVFCVTVQSHGKYPSEQVYEDPRIAVAGDGLTDEERYQYEYYVNEIYDVDRFVGALTAMLADFDEPTVLVLYGDHLPCLPFDENDLETGDMYTTEYVIWSNYGLTGEDMNMESYLLSSRLLEMLGINSGVLPSFHRAYSENPDTRELLETVEYDMLYGDRIALGGESYEKSELRFGIRDVEVTSFRTVGDSIYVSGRNFTPYSVVFTDRLPRDTEYMDSSTLLISGSDMKYVKEIDVKQISPDGFVYENGNLN